MRALSSDFVLAYCVTDDAPGTRYTGELEDDLLPREVFEQLSPELIVVEDGLFGPMRDFRIKLTADQVANLHSDPVVVIAGTDKWQLQHYQKDYHAVWTFLGARAVYGRSNQSPVYGAQQNPDGNWSAFHLCKAEDMYTSHWLLPVFEGIGAVGVDEPIPIVPHTDCVATSGLSSGTLDSDVWVDMRENFPWGSVDVRLHATVCWLTGDVVSDRLLDWAPENTPWLTKLCTFLVQSRKAEEARVMSHLRSRDLVFLGHRSIDKPVVRALSKALRGHGVATWFDENEIELGDSIVAAVNSALERATFFVLCWSRHCIGAPWVERELNTAVHALVEGGVPLVVVRLDDAPVPRIISDLRRLDAMDLEPTEIARSLVVALEARRRRSASEQA